MKNKIQIGLIIVINFILIRQTYSQSLDQINSLNIHFPNYPLSPSTSNLMKYGKVENSEYTGSNSPSINLYNIQSGSLSFPVELKYISGNGIKVADEAGSVGLGWTLPIPSITQFVMGFDDFDSSYSKFRPDFAYSSTPYASYFPSCYGALGQYINGCEGTTGFNQLPSYETFGYFLASDWNLPLGGNFTMQLPGKDVLYSFDSQQDIFILNLFGEKIEFIIDNFPTYPPNNHIENPNFYVLNKKGYKIEYFSNKFTITDRNGINYYFEDIENITDDGYLIKHKNYYISSISNYKGDYINFTYNEIEEAKNLPVRSDVLLYTKSSSDQDYNGFYTPAATLITPYDQMGFGNDNSNCLGVPSFLTGTFMLRVKKTNSFQNYKFVDRIVSKSDSIVFSYSEREDRVTKKLDVIKVHCKNQQIFKEIVFNYDYFNSTNSTNNFIVEDWPSENISDDYKNKRLKLNNIKINDIEEYGFEYNPVLLPPKNSFATDYWGFSNGGFSNTSFALNINDFSLPGNPIPFNSTFTNNLKSSNAYYTKSAILEKILYPTKGFSKFEYESNSSNNLFTIYDYSNLTSGNGLRLTSQINYDKNNVFINKTKYSYINGVSMNPNALTHYDFYKTISRVSTMVYKVRENDFVSMHSNSTISSSPLSSGNYIGYTKVIKTEVDSLDNSIGRIETQYTNIGDKHFYIAQNNKPIFIPSVKGNKFENGLVINRSVFDSQNNKLNETINDYINVVSNFHYGISITDRIKYKNNYSNDEYFNPLVHPITALGYYPIYSKETLLSSSENIDYLPSGLITNKTYYYYDSYNQLSSESFLNSSGSNIETNYFYPYNFTTENYMTQLISNNRLSEKIAINRKKNGELVENKKVIYMQYNLIWELVLPKEVMISKDNNYVSKIIYDSYDNNGNLTQYTPNSSVATSIIWGYNKTLPIAKIENATNAQVQTALGMNLSDVTEANMSIINALRASLPNAMVTTYTHIPLVGVSTITDPKSDTITYIYDSFNRLKEVKDKNGNKLSENQYHYRP